MLLFASACFADEVSTLQLGSRVRVYFDEDSDKGSRTQDLTGNLGDLDDETLSLESTFHDDAPDTVAIARESISRMDLRTREGKRTQWAVLGFGIGFATGMVLGLMDGDDRSGFVRFSAEEKGVMMGLPLGVLGLILGAAAAPGQEWQSVDPAGARLSNGTTGRSRQWVSVATRF